MTATAESSLTKLPAVEKATSSVGSAGECCSTQNIISNVARTGELLGEGCWAKPRAAVCCAWFLTATFCLQDVGPGEGSAERFTLGSQSWACPEALNQFSYLEQQLKLVVTRDTVRSLLFVESLLLSKGHPCIRPTKHPTTLLSMQLSTHPTIYQPICQADATFCRKLFKISLLSCSSCISLSIIVALWPFSEWERKRLGFLRKHSDLLARVWKL